MRDERPECPRWQLLHPASVELDRRAQDGSGGIQLKPPATRLEWCRGDELPDSETSDFLLLARRLQRRRLNRVLYPAASYAGASHRLQGKTHTMQYTEFPSQPSRCQPR